MAKQSPVLKVAYAHQAEVADLIVAYFEQLGIEYVFGVPGGAIEPLYNALARSARRGGPRPIIARHEAGAAFMADGYARETGKIGVCCATSGPGATNLITGVATAHDNGVPMLVITGQPVLPAFGRRALQESACTGINTLGMFRHCTRYNSLVSHPEQIEHKLVDALMHAVRPPRGPAHLSFPLDIMRSPIPSAKPSYDLGPKLQVRAMLDQDAFAQLCEMMDQARKPIMLIGGWCGEAAASILQYALRQGIPFVTTPDGKGLVNPAHPCNQGVFGFAGHVSADATLRDPNIDLVLAVGTSMNEWTSSGWSDTLLNGRLVHIDSVDEHLMQSPMARLHVRGNIRTVFDRLLARLDESANPAAPVERADPARFLTAEDKQAMHSDAGPILPQRLMHELGRRLPPSTRFLADAGNSVAWSIHYLTPGDQRLGERRTDSKLNRRHAGRRQSNGGWLRVTMDFAPMGWAIGAAVGTAAGNPEAPVVCITGDGSMLMSGQEISVAVAENMTVIYVVLNDRALGMVKHGQRLAGAEQIGFQLPPTDFAAMARAMGASAHVIRSPADFDAIDFQAMVRHPGPTLLDVHIDPEQIPPMNLRMRILGTA
ncbi:MAG TPA: thiamine pyrophosphate-binding protein [Rhodocyclaceae bacterium]